MRDRIPASGMAGRVLITPESGASYYARITRADNPVQAGDALNKKNLLPDDVAGKLGLDPANNPVPADAFEKIADTVGTELLWENASPASNFVAQKLTLDLSAYKKVEIIYAQGANQSPVFMPSTMFQVGVSNAQRYNINGPSYAGTTYRRDVQIPDTTGISFSDAVTSLASSTSTENNRLVPLTIYGVKEAY